MNIKKNISKFLINIEKKTTRKLKGHNYKKEIGTRYLLCDKQLYKTSKFYLALRIFKNAKNKNNVKQHVLKHKHNVDSYWFFGGTQKDLKGLTIKICIGADEHILKSPISVYIPKNIEHYYIPIEGSGFYLNFVLTGKKNYNDVTFLEVDNNDRKKTSRSNKRIH